MESYKYLEIVQQSQVLTVWLNRPEVHNALNSEMIQELLHFFMEVNYRKDIRLIYLRGKGPSYCAGADINWLREVSRFDYEQNHLESLTLARCLFSIYTCNKPVISIVHGSVIGGGNGLAAASDICYALEETQFAFSEVSLGLIPAVISPYIVRKIGEARSRELMITAKRFNASDAERFGLVNETLAESELEHFIEKISKKILQNSPEAMHKTKVLLQHLPAIPEPENWMTYTSEIIAKARISDEGQEGMNAFLQKRKPGWVADINIQK